MIFFTNRIVNNWNSLPYDVANATSVNSFKNKFDNYKERISKWKKNKKQTLHIIRKTINKNQPLNYILNLYNFVFVFFLNFLFTVQKKNEKITFIYFDMYNFIYFILLSLLLYFIILQRQETKDFLNYLYTF